MLLYVYQKGALRRGRRRREGRRGPPQRGGAGPRLCIITYCNITLYYILLHDYIIIIFITIIISI